MYIGDIIYLSSPYMIDEGYEVGYITEAFNTNWIAPLGTNINQFEKELVSYVGSKHAAALSSGTAAIHMALKAADIGRGQLKVLDDRVSKKKYIYEYYKRELGDLEGIGFMPKNEWDNSNYRLCFLVFITYLLLLSSYGGIKGLVITSPIAVGSQMLIQILGI